MHTIISKILPTSGNHFHKPLTITRTHTLTNCMGYNSHCHTQIQFHTWHNSITPILFNNHHINPHETIINISDNLRQYAHKGIADLIKQISVDFPPQVFPYLFVSGYHIPPV